MKKSLIWLCFFVVFLIVAACGQPSPAVPTIPAPSPTPVNVAPILDAVTQLTVQRSYFVFLKFVKHNALSPIENMKNEFKAVHQTIVVGQRTYDEMAVGQELSTKFDGFGLLFNGDFATYKVVVEDKQFTSQYLWNDQSGESHEITFDEYQAASAAVAKEKTVLTVEYSGVTVTTVLDMPINEMIIVNKVPLIRYFVQILVKNENLTMDFTKMLRNASTVHHIIFEVPAEQYNTATDGEAWTPTWNPNSIILSGRVSQLHGSVESHWTEEDLAYVVITTDTGLVLVVPSELVK